MKFKFGIWSFLIVFVMMAMWLPGCRSKHFFSVPPDYDSIQVQRIIQPSLIQIPIEVPMQVFTNEMNKNFNGLIYNDTLYDNNDNDNLKVKIWRIKKQIKVDGHKQKIRFQLPLEIWAKYRWMACDICPAVEKSTSFDLDLTLVTQAQLGKDWTLVTTTTATDMQFSKEPVLDFGIVQIPVTRLIKGILNTHMPTITKSIDQEVSSALPVKTYMEDAWKQVQEPILLDSAYQAWLLMKPKNILITPLKCDVHKLSLQAGMETWIETHIGKKPEVKLKSFLNPPVVKEKLSNQFMLELPIKIDFDMATHIARANLKDSTFQISKNKKITITDVNIYGRSGFAFIEAHLKGSFNGAVFFKGKPSLDTLTHTLYLKDFDYDINTKNGLYSIASWMLHGTLKRIMEKQFRYSIASDLDAARLSINRLMNGYVYDKYFQINGQVGKLKLSDVYCTDQGIHAIFNTSGQSHITFLNFTP